MAAVLVVPVDNEGLELGDGHCSIDCSFLPFGQGLL